MKRIVKDPAVRRLEIMLAAEKLFEKKGYTKTSVEAIIKKAKIAKGTFYYYFKTKADILKALVERAGSDMVEHYHTIIDVADSSAIEKLHKMIRGAEKKAKTKTAVMNIIHKPENRELQEQLNIHTVENLAPLIANVFKQGFDEGVFSRQASVETIKLILAGSQFMLDSGLFDLSVKERKTFLKAVQELLEEICGAKSGVLNFIAKE